MFVNMYLRTARKDAPDHIWHFILLANERKNLNKNYNKTKKIRAVTITFGDVVSGQFLFKVLGIPGHPSSLYYISLTKQQMLRAIGEPHVRYQQVGFDLQN